MYLSGRRNENFDYECYARKLQGRSSWQVLARQSDTVLGLDSQHDCQIHSRYHP